MNVLTTNENVKAFESFINGGIDIARKLPEGDHTVIFTGISINLDRQTITILFTKNNETYEDKRYFKADKIASIEITLKQLGLQLGLQGNVTPKDFNDHTNKEITVYARIPEGYKTVFYNYAAPYTVTTTTTSDAPVDGKDF